MRHWLNRAGWINQNVWIGLWFLALTVLVTFPLWSSPSLPAQGDAPAHLFRGFAFDRALRQGIVYPRWFDDLAFGQSYPNLNFYPPFAVYLTEFFHVLGFSFIQALKLEIILIVFLAGWGTFQMSATIFNHARGAKVAGVLAGTMYLTAPYLIYNIYFKGGIPEALAIALLPWLVWSLFQLCRNQTIGAQILVALFVALLLLAHILTAVLAAPLLIGLVLFEFSRLKIARLRVLIQLGIAGVLGLGLAAIYWLPSFAELNLVNAGQGLAIAEATTSTHAVPPERWISFAWVYPYGSLSLGIVSVVAAMLGVISAIKNNNDPRRRLMIFVSVLTALAAVALTEWSMPIWRIIPGSSSIGYVWRVTILVDLGLAILVGYAAKGLWQINDARKNFAITGVGALASTLVLSSTLPLLAPQVVPPNALKVLDAAYPIDELTLPDLARFEAYSGFVGLTNWDEFFPTTVRAPAGISVLPAPAIAPNAQIDLIAYTANRREFQIAATEPVSLTMRTFYYPDWRAQIDEKELAPYPSTSLGWLTVNVPPGNHRVIFYQDDLPPRRLGVILTLGSILGIFVLLGVAWRRQESGLTFITGWLGATIFVVLLPTVVAVTARPLRVQSMQAAVAPQVNLIGLDIENGARTLDGWRVEDTVLRLRVYWQVRMRMNESFFRWQLVDANGQIRAMFEHAPRFGTGWQRTWQPNQIIQDHYDLTLDYGIPAGRYTLQVAYAENYLPVAQIDLRNPRAAMQPDDVSVIARVGEIYRVIRHDAEPTVTPGKSYIVRVDWQTDRVAYSEHVPFAQLIDARGERVAQHDTVVGLSALPTSLWTPGKIVSVKHTLDIPRDLKPGLYALVTGMYTQSNQHRLPVIANQSSPLEDTVWLSDIKAPMNTQSAEPAHRLNYSLGSNIRLLGYDLQSTREQANLKLYWQAREKMQADYKVFVHVVDAGGRVVAQVDQMPDAGKYPTHIWDAGEIVIDEYSLSLGELPAGKYQIVVGMYAPDTGEPLIITDSQGRELENRQIEIASFEMNPP